MKSDKKIKEQIKKLPQGAGVYFFKDKTGRILYIGKAVNIRNRVRSHFSNNGQAVFKSFLLDNVSEIDCIETENESQALILEDKMIKKYQPRYNIQWKDDKTYFWVAFTEEKWPRVRVVHQTELNRKINLFNKEGCLAPIGPFVSGRELKALLRNLRKIIPFRTCKNPYEKACLQWHIGLCPAHGLKTKAGSINKKYLRSLNLLAQILRLYAGESIRTEAYDISNIHGNWATGSMIVFQGNKPKKSDYRRFKIRTVEGANDTAMIKEVLSRRLGHKEWPYPKLMLIDGGKGQLNAARSAVRAKKEKINLFSLAKREDEIYTEYSDKGLKVSLLPQQLRLVLQAVRNEAHRFAIFYYRHLHGKEFRGNRKVSRKKISMSTKKETP